MTCRSLPAEPAIRVKICGLKTPETVAAAVDAGAVYLGFVLFPPSPRAITLEKLKALAADVPAGIARVALVVDPDAALIDALAGAPLDMVQLHGQESPALVQDVKKATGLPVMKAFGVRDAGDLDRIAEYAAVCDQLLIDAKPPRDASRPGGLGLSFDWDLLRGRRWPLPWMLAGGLTPDNVARAIHVTGARQLDVSSSVESAPGIKDPARIAAFMDAVSHVSSAPRLV